MAHGTAELMSIACVCTQPNPTASPNHRGAFTHAFSTSYPQVPWASGRYTESMERDTECKHPAVWQPACLWSNTRLRNNANGQFHLTNSSSQRHSLEKFRCWGICDSGSWLSMLKETKDGASNSPQKYLELCWLRTKGEGRVRQGWYSRVGTTNTFKQSYHVVC